MGGRRRRKGEVQRLSNNIRLKKRGKEKESKKWGRRRGEIRASRRGRNRKECCKRQPSPPLPSSLPASLFFFPQVVLYCRKKVVFCRVPSGYGDGDEVGLAVISKRPTVHVHERTTHFLSPPPSPLLLMKRRRAAAAAAHFQPSFHSSSLDRAPLGAHKHTSWGNAH